MSVLLFAAGLLSGCGQRDETVAVNPVPRPSAVPSGVATAGATSGASGASGAPSASAAPQRTGIPVTVPACSAAPAAAPARLATAKENLAKAPADRFAKVRVGSESAARAIPQPEGIGAMFDRMGAPLPSGDAVLVMCKAEATSPPGSGETLEITATIGATPVFFARTSPFAIAGAMIAPGQPLRFSAAKTSETCTLTMTGWIPIPSKVCTPQVKPLQAVSTAAGATLPAVLSGPDLRVECRGLDRAGVEREAREPFAEAEKDLAEQCARLGIDPADGEWGGPGGGVTRVLWGRTREGLGGLVGLADPRVESLERRAAAMHAEWQPAFGAWVQRKAAELTVGAAAGGKSGARYRVAAPLSCSGWGFSPAKDVPLGKELPKGFRACWVGLEIRNGTQAALALRGDPFPTTVGGEAAEPHVATGAGERPEVFVRGVPAGNELRAVARVDETIAPGAAVQLVVTLFLSDAAARGTDPLLLGVGGEALLRLR